MTAVPPVTVPSTKEDVMMNSMRFLRNVLFADGLTSGVTGVMLVVLAGPVASAVGGGGPLLIAAVGVALIGFGAALLRSARRGLAMQATARVAVTLNAAWVVSSAVVLLGGWLTTLGNWAVALVAVAVLGFTALEVVGLLGAAHRSLPSSGIAVALLSVLSLSTSVAQSHGGAQPADDAAVRVVVAQISDAWNRRDMRGAAAAFTADGTLISGNGTTKTGREAVERYLGEVAAALPNGTRFSATVTSVRFLERDVALVLSKGGFLMPGDTTVTTERLGLQSIIFVRANGAWRAALYQRTRILPPNPTPR